MAKKVSKPKLKQGKYAAVVTLRILPDEMPDYDFILERYSKKNYTDAINAAVGNIKFIETNLRGESAKNFKLEREAEGYRGEIMKLRQQLYNIGKAKQDYDELINAIKF